MDFLTEKKVFRFLVIAVLFFTLMFLMSITSFIFMPIGAYLAAIAVPIVGSGILYYITNPLVNLLEKYKVPRLVGILIVFLLLIAFVFFSVNVLIPIVQEQFNKLVANTPNMARSMEELFILWQNRQNYLPESLENAIQNVIDNLNTYVEGITGFLFSFIGQIFSFLFSFVLIPFFLFFMLKDGKKFVPFVTSFLSDKKAKSLAVLLKNVNKTLSSFIQGQFIVSFSVGIMLLAGYLIVDLNYAVMLALFGLVMNLIPFVGPWISAIPAVIIGFFQDPMVGLWTAVIMIVAQQIESNLISPNVMGRVLKIHPLTVITLILAAGAIAGFIGLLFIIPSYAVFKTVISHFYHEWQENQSVGEKKLF